MEENAAHLALIYSFDGFWVHLNRILLRQHHLSLFRSMNYTKLLKAAAPITFDKTELFNNFLDIE